MSESIMRCLLCVIIALAALYPANNPSVTINVDLGGADAVLVGKTATVSAELQWPSGDFPKPTGSYTWTTSDGVSIESGQGGASITIKGVRSEKAKVSVQWYASGYDSPKADKYVTVIGIGLGVWGRIVTFTGDMYDSAGNTFIPPGGTASLTGSASDKDAVGGEYLADTFDDYGAYVWKAKKGTASRDQQNSCSYLAPSEPVLDVVEMYLKDDGKYFPDREEAKYEDSRLVYVYQLTGLKVKGALPEQQFTGANFVDLELEETFPGLRPEIKYEAIDQSGNVVVSETTTLGTWKLKVAKPGRYTYRVTNVARSSETFTKSDYTFYTLKFGDARKKFDWETDELLRGIAEVQQKRGEVEGAFKEFADVASAVGDVCPVTKCSDTSPL